MLRRNRLLLPLFASALVLCLFICTASYSILFFFDRIVNWRISEAVKLQNESMALASWRSSDTTNIFSAYFYNLTNPLETLAGEKPRLEKIGPYVYRQREYKEKISWTEVDGVQAISYFSRYTYQFDRELSAGDPQEEMITTVNLPILAISAANNAGRGPSSSTVELIKTWTNPKIFTTQTAHGLLWGYTDTMLSMCMTFYPETCPSDKVGILTGTNNTLQGPYVIDAGIKNSSNVANLLVLNGKRRLNIWSTERANEIRGTDGTRLAGGIRHGDSREIFIILLCQPIRLIARDTTNSSVFQQLEVVEMQPDTSEYPSGDGYCPLKASGPKCPPQGFFDISQCVVAGDVAPPIVASLPGFLELEEKNIRISDASLENDEKSDNFRLIVEPKSGIVVEAHIRLQVNAYIERSVNLAGIYKNLSDPLYWPIAVFKNDVVGGPEAVQMLHTALYEHPKRLHQTLSKLAFFTSVLLGFLVVLVAGLAVIQKRQESVCLHCPSRQSPSVSHILPDGSIASTSDLNLRNNEDTVVTVAGPWRS